MGFAINPDETDMAHQSSQARASVTTYSTAPEIKDPEPVKEEEVEEEIDLETALTSL